MHSAYLGDISYDFLAYGHRIAEGSVLAGALQLFDFGSIDRRDLNNVDQGQFHPRSFLYSLAYAQALHEVEEGSEISAGLALKLLRSRIVQTASSYAADFGFVVRVPGDYPHKLALVVQNLGLGPKYDVDRERLPFQLKGGVSYAPSHWVFSLDLAAPRDNKPYGAVGVEYKMGWTRTLNGSLRAGYNSLTQSGGPSGLTGASFGLGLELAGFSFDYATVLFGNLGVTHQLSVNYALPAFEED